jgi:hypothetical protein
MYRIVQRTLEIPALPLSKDKPQASAVDECENVLMTLLKILMRLLLCQSDIVSR